MVGKVALGMTHQEVTINGGSVLLGPTGNAITAVPGGVQALTSNIGRYSSDQFTVVPELGINLAYDVTERLRVRVGYSFLYCSSVARPGQQIDFTLNPGLVPTDATYGTAANPARPGPTGSRSDFWAQTVNLGFEFRY